MENECVTINRAPVLALWGAAVAERQGHAREAALTLGKCMAGLNAQSKGRRIGIFKVPESTEGGGKPKKAGLGEDFWVKVCGRPVPVKETPEGERAVIEDRPLDPAQVQKYLEKSFGADLPRVREAMQALAGAYTPDELEDESFALYEKFRPQIEAGKRGWGQKGVLDLALLREMARRPAQPGLFTTEPPRHGGQEE